MSVIIFILYMANEFKTSFWCWIPSLHFHVAVCNIVWGLLVNECAGRPACVHSVPHPPCPR
jgi:hypothetical protein